MYRKGTQHNSIRIDERDIRKFAEEKGVAYVVRSIGPLSEVLDDPDEFLGESASNDGEPVDIRTWLQTMAIEECYSSTRCVCQDAPESVSETLSK